MAQGKKSTGPGGLSAESILVFIGIGLFASSSVGIWGALKIAAAINDTRPVPNPMTALADLIKGRSTLVRRGHRRTHPRGGRCCSPIAGGVWFLAPPNAADAGRPGGQVRRQLMSKRSTRSTSSPARAPRRSPTGSAPGTPVPAS